MPSNERWQALVSDPAALLGVLFDHMPMGIALFDRDGVLRAFNPTWAALIDRYGPAHARPIRTGLPVRLVLGAETDQAAWFRTVFDRAIAGDTVRRDAIRLKSGDQIGWLDFVHAPVREHQDIVGIMEVCVDVTERVLADERARHLAAIVESTSEAVVGSDLSGTIISWNRGAERVYGYTAQEAIGQPVAIIYPPDEHIAVPDILTRIAAGEQIEQIEARRRRKDGALIDVAITLSPITDSSGMVVGASSITRDITARKHAEAALRERELQYRSIFETTSDGLSITAAGSGTLVEVNPALCAMVGYSREQLQSMHWNEVVHPDYHEQIRSVAPPVVADGEFRLQVTLVRRDGSLLPIELQGLQFVYKGGPALLTVARDITEHLRSMELLEERVAERTRELTSMLEIARTVATTLELEPLLGLIFEQLNQFIVDYAGATIWLIDDDSMTAVASTVLPAIQGIRSPRPSHETPWREIEQYQTVVIHDVLDDNPLTRAYNASHPAHQPRAGLNVRSWAGIPMLIKEQLIGMLAVSSAEPGFFTPRRVELLTAIASQAAVAVENTRLLAEAQHAAALEERQRLARELHDSVSQALYGIALGAKTARTLLDRDPSKAAEPLDYVLSLADAGLAEMRALIFELRPDSLAEEGLVAALEKQADALRARHRVDVVVSLPPEPDAPLAVEEALYRIAQEALHNTVKHAKASRVELCLRDDSGRLTLEIRDDGRGFDPNGDFPGHLGLRSMRERAANAGATLTIESRLGIGTVVRVVGPHPPAPSPQRLGEGAGG